MAGSKLAPGQMDVCLLCGKPIIYGRWEFWADTGEPVGKPPPYPGMMGFGWDEERKERWRKENEAHEAWLAMKKTRETVSFPGWSKGWVHVVNRPIRVKDDLVMAMPTPEENRRYPNDKTHSPQPSSWCMRSLNSGGHCERVAKDTWRDGHSFEALCGLHLSQERKYQKEQEERENSEQLQSWLRSELEEKIARLDRLGIQAEMQYVIHYGGRYSGSYSGKIIVDPDQLLEILDQNVEVFE